MIQVRIRSVAVVRFRAQKNEDIGVGCGDGMEWAQSGWQGEGNGKLE